MSEGRELRVVVLEPGRNGVEVLVDGDLESLQLLVGGWVQAVHVEDYLVLCDEDGRRKSLPVNRTLGGHEFVGTLVVTKRGPDGEFASLDGYEARSVISNWSAIQ